MKQSIKQIAQLDGRYNVAAIHFVHQALGVAANKIKQNSLDSEYTPRHITGQQLSLGIAELAAEKWGLLAKMVLNNWGIHTTRDFGEIVYLMIEHSWMNAQPSDSIDDFNDVYDFEEIFEKKFSFKKAE